MDMRRREFVTLIGRAVVGWPVLALGQVPSKRSLIVWFGLGNQMVAQKYQGIFRAGLEELGYAEGRNIEIIGRFADFKVERLDALAGEIATLKPALIVASSSDTALAAKKATLTIPIVSGALADAEHLGLVASYARPGGNVTGIMPYVAGLPSKQIELAREVVPVAAKIGLLGNINDPKVGPQLDEMKNLAQTLGLAVVVPEVTNPESIASAIQVFARERVDVVVVLESTLMLNFRRQIASLMAVNRLPSVYGYRDHVEEGGLISYGVDLRWCWNRTAAFAQKILSGVAPADLPVEFPTRIQLALNLKTARELGIALAPTLIARADEVIE
jgi:putative tryptophan/tyrosine transport system substrate-binding protein